MTHTEWIISLDDDMKDHDEIFVGNVTDGERLTRCKDCKYYQQGHHSDDWLWCMMNHHYTDEEKYCAWAERWENDTAD